MPFMPLRRTHFLFTPMTTVDQVCLRNGPSFPLPLTNCGWMVSTRGAHQWASEAAKPFFLRGFFQVRIIQGNKKNGLGRGSYANDVSYDVRAKTFTGKANNATFVNVFDPTLPTIPVTKHLQRQRMLVPDFPARNAGDPIRHGGDGGIWPALLAALL